MTHGLDRRYALRNDVAVEDFGDSSLAFQAADNTLTKINGTTRRLLRALNGRDTVADIARRMATESGAPETDIAEDLLGVLEQLESQRIVKQVYRDLLEKGRISMNSESVYLADPDVSCRIEDEDGAILYSPDTAATQVINPVGLEIWETLASPHSEEELVAHLKQVCEEVPEDDVRRDVNEFLSRLLKGGFIGAVERKPND